MDVINNLSGLASIRFLTGPLAGSTYPISKPAITIGREPTNDIAISDPSVSRHHARLVKNGTQWSIEKLSPQNVVTVNQHNVQQAIISDGDTIGLGTGTTFLFLTSPDLSSGNQRSGKQVSPQQVHPAYPVTPQQAAPTPTPSYGGQQPFATQAATSPDIPSGTERFTPAGIPGTGGLPSLEVSSNVHADKQVRPLTKQVINIGRDPSNDIVINDLVISAFHAQIVRDGNQLVLVHPHPSRGKTLNGLLYQGRHIRGDQPFRKPLARGDIFRIGDEHGTLITLTFNDGSGATQDIVPELRPIPLGAPIITIGRIPDNTVVLNHPQVSGHHARLEQVQGGYRIVDLGSTNHVYINARRVTNQQLQPGDEVRIGPYKLTYTGTQLTQQDESNGVRIDALHLQKVGNKETILINDISIAVPPRKFIALVGGSGAGKSTLMDALNGLRPAQKGVVLYNGQDYYRHLAAFSTQLGYVPQDDIVHRDLTVERALYYTAKMRLPDDFTEAQTQQRIDEVLEDVDMKHRRGLLVSKLSGGQRKRVSIALELLANPSVFFLDEPTSGLDPGLDRKMMFLLRNLADKGHTIVLVTHATNNINTCDYICFLAQGGRLAYYGPPNDAKAFFGKTDFAEIYSALEPTEENQNIPAEAEARFKASPDFQKYVVGPLNSGPAGRANAPQETVAVKPPKRGNPWKQFSLLSRRYLELLKNDTGNLLILLLQAPIIGLILFLMLLSGGKETFTPTSVATCPNVQGVPIAQLKGSTSLDCQDVLNFFNSPQGHGFLQQKDPGKTSQEALQDFILGGAGQDAQKYLFIMAFAAVMFGCINGAREIVKEAPIYRRERTVNLGIVPYMFSKIAVLGTLCLVQSAILVIMVSVVAPFHQGVFLPVTLEIYITMALTSLAGLMTGLTISALVPNNDRAMSFVPIILIPQVIFSGIIFQVNGPFMQFIAAFFAARWSMAAMGTSLGIHGDRLGGDTFSYQGTLFSTNSQTQATLHLLLCWFFLAAMIVVLGLLTAYFLKRKDVRA
jgi:ABC-type multidrug transport system ATPase subunit